MRRQDQASVWIQGMRPNSMPSSASARDSSALKPDDQAKDEYEDCHDRNTQSAVAGAGRYGRVDRLQIAQHLACGLISALWILF